MINTGLFSSINQEWTTPINLYNDLNKEFNFICDVATNGVNNLCDKFILNALDPNIDWDKINFCNPPYVTKIQDQYFLKAHQQALKGNVTVMLVPARTDVKRFHDIVLKYNYEIRFIKGRLKFGNSKNSAPFPSMIIIFK